MSPDSGLFENIYLFTFLFGLVFTVVSVALGASHVGGLDGQHAHVGDLGGHNVDLGGHAGHLGDVGPHAAHSASGVDTQHGAIHVGNGEADGADGALDALPVLNMPTIMAFLTWFGGAGYIVTRTFSLGPFFSVPLALASGLTGGTIMFLLLARVLWPMRSKPLSTADFRLPGTAARVVSSIREGGVGEIVYNKAGSRFTAGARAVNGKPVPKGAEVVIIRYERGLAYVQPITEILEDTAQQAGSESAATQS